MLAVILHEVAHGYAALKLGDTTARDMGRLTLNPIPHIDPVGTIIIPLALVLMNAGFIFGYAKPVPVNFLRLKNPKKGMILVAAAGPATNLLLALAAALVLRVVYLIDPNLFIPLLDSTAADGLGPKMIATALNILFYLLFISVVLALFNLIPIPPLDGGRIVTGLLPDEAARSYAQIEPFGIFIVIGMLIFIDLFQKLLFAGILLVSGLFLGGNLLTVMINLLFPG
jgi:Zn-dependent protease